jgi:hypothetical protein
MAQDHQDPTEWVVASVKDAVDARSQQVRDSSKASLDASRAVMEIGRETATILKDRGNEAFSTAMAVMSAGFEANFEQLTRMADTQNLQDVVRLQMMWGANQTVAICHALIKANKSHAVGGARPAKAAHA